LERQVTILKRKRDDVQEKIATKQRAKREQTNLPSITEVIDLTAD